MLPLHRLQCIVFSQCNVLVFTENFLGSFGFEGRKRKFKKLAKKGKLLSEHLSFCSELERNFETKCFGSFYKCCLSFGLGFRFGFALVWRSVGPGIRQTMRHNQQSVAGREEDRIGMWFEDQNGDQNERV